MRRPTSPNARLNLLESLESRRLLANIVVTTLADSVAGAETSLRDALAQADANAEADIITFGGTAANGGTITLDALNGQLEIASTEAITITAPSAGVTVDAAGNSRGLVVGDGATVSISNLSFSNGDTITSDARGGNIAVGEGATFTMVDGSLTGGVANQGGGLYAVLATVSLTDVDITGNLADDTEAVTGGFGGGVRVLGSDLTIVGGNISGNTAGTLATEPDPDNVGELLDDSGSGAGIAVGALSDGEDPPTLTPSTFSISGVTFDGNVAANPEGNGDAGGIRVDGSSGSVSNSTFQNHSTGFGAGMLTFNSDITLNEVTFLNHDATGSGGALYFDGGTIDDATTVTNTLVINGGSIENSTAGGGGAMIIFDGDADIDDLDVINSSVTGNGGGIFSQNGNLELTNSLIQGSVSDSGVTGGGGFGGGVLYARFSVAPGTVTFENNEFYSNTARVGGGAFIQDAEFFSTNDQFGDLVDQGDDPDLDLGNDARNDGGGLFLNGGDGVHSITGTTFTGNNSETVDDPEGTGAGGGMIYFGQNDGTLSIADSEFLSNDGDVFGGGAILVNRGGGGAISITGTTFAGNAAQIGGGLDYNGPSTGAPPALTALAGGDEVDGVATYTASELETLKRSGYQGEAATLTSVERLVRDANGRTSVVTQERPADRTDDRGTSRGLASLTTPALFDDSSMTISNSTFENNIGFAGGGARFFFGRANVIDTNFINNNGFFSLPLANRDFVNGTGEVTGTSNGGGIFSISADLAVERSAFIGNDVTFPETFETVDPDTNLPVTLTLTLEAGVEDSSGGGIDWLGSDNNADGAATAAGARADLSFVNSTIGGNIAADAAGARFEGSLGDTGDFPTTFDLTFVNSTIFDNEATNTAGGIQLVNQAFAVPAFGVPEANAFFYNTVLSGNTADGAVSNYSDISQDLDPGTVPVTVLFDNNYLGSDLAGEAADNLIGDAPLLSEAVFGGGTTGVYVPLIGSPLLDAGDNALAKDPGDDALLQPSDSTLTLDARGSSFFDRFFDYPTAAGTGVDIGAVEKQGPDAGETGVFDIGMEATVSFTFDQSIDASTAAGTDLVLVNNTTEEEIDTTGVTTSYDPGTNTLTFDLTSLIQNGLLTNGNYTATLAAFSPDTDAGDPDGVFGLNGSPNALSASVDFSFVNGDANRDLRVNLADFGILRGNFGAQSGVGFLQADFNLDGRVNLADFGILRGNFGFTLPAPTASLFSEEAAGF
jgi:hypothetical protein